MPALRVAVKDPRQQVIDRHAAPDGLPGKAPDKADQTGARAVGQAELELRRLDASRDDVDDPPEATLHHAVDGSRIISMWHSIMVSSAAIQSSRVHRGSRRAPAHPRCSPGCRLRAGLIRQRALPWW